MCVYAFGYQGNANRTPTGVRIASPVQCVNNIGLRRTGERARARVEAIDAPLSGDLVANSARYLPCFGNYFLPLVRCQGLFVIC